VKNDPFLKNNLKVAPGSSRGIFFSRQPGEKVLPFVGEKSTLRNFGTVNFAKKRSLEASLTKAYSRL
jgi:hypothetical protein